MQVGGCPGSLGMGSCFLAQVAAQKKSQRWKGEKEEKGFLERVGFTEQSEKMHSDPQSERSGNSTAKTPVQQWQFIVTHSYCVITDCWMFENALTSNNHLVMYCWSK